MIPMSLRRATRIARPWSTSYAKFAAMSDRHREVLNNKIRVLKRRAYGLSDQGSSAQDPHLHLRLLTQGTRAVLQVSGHPVASR